ncbi:hypothetical protein FXO38_13526 [Capsicum annuum]|nr:hypothetical protein FXO38_13526 [Capsicum annuum]
MLVGVSTTQSWKDMYRSMSSNNIKGLVLALSSSVFIGASFIVKKKGLKKVVASSVRAGNNCGTAMRSLTEVVVVAGGNSRCGLIGMNSSKGNLGWSAWRVKEMVKVGVVQEMTIIHPAIISFSTILSSKASYNVSILSMMGNTLKILFVVPFQVEIHCRKHVQCNLVSAKHCVYYYCWSRSQSYSKSTPFFDASVQRPVVKLPEVTETLLR